jgi:hypothetical protein
MTKDNQEDGSTPLDKPKCPLCDRSFFVDSVEDGCWNSQRAIPPP